MKRSEMIKHIQKELDIHNSMSEESISAKTVLRIVEDLGMSPPGRWSCVLRGDTAKEEQERCSWEPEE